MLKIILLINNLQYTNKSDVEKRMRQSDAPNILNEAFCENS